MFEMLDWTKVGELGVGIVGILALVYVVKLFITGFFSVWEKSVETQKESNKVLDQNTKAYEALSQVIETTHQKEMKFQKEVLTIIKDTNEKVVDIHTYMHKGDGK